MIGFECGCIRDCSSNGEHFDAAQEERNNVILMNEVIFTKRILSIILIFATLTCMLTGCDDSDKSLNAKADEQKSSGVPISDLELLISDFESGDIGKYLRESTEVEKVQTKDGYAINHGVKMLFADFSIKGKADSDEMLTEVNVTCNWVDIDYFLDLTLDTITCDSINIGDVPSMRATGDVFFMECLNIVQLLNPELIPQDDKWGAYASASFYFLLDAIKTPQIQGDWQYTITIDANDETVTFDAEFISEK